MRLRDEYKDKVVKVNSGNGLIAFDTTTTPESEYPVFHNLGFDFCFEPEPPKYTKPKRYIGLYQDKKASTKGNKVTNDKASKAKAKKA